MSKLKITDQDPFEEKKAFDPRRERLLKKEAECERGWKESPRQMEEYAPKELVEWIKRLAKEHPRILAIGAPKIAKELFLEGNDVTLMDISRGALLSCPSGMKVEKGAFPTSRLKEESFDLVLFIDLIAGLDKGDYRLAISELERLLAKGGRALLTSAIDIDSTDALDRLKALVETEFKIEKATYLYLAPLIRISRFANYPMLTFKAFRSPPLREKELERRSGLSRKLFSLFSTKLSYLLLPFGYLLKPLTLLEKSTFLERLVKLFWQEEGISYAEYLLVRRSLSEEREKPLPERAPFIQSREWQ